MKTILRVLLCGLALAALAFSQGAAVVVPFSTLAAVGATASYNASALAPARHTIEFAVTGSPAACTLRLEGSVAGTAWADLSGAQDCKAAGMFHVADRPVMYVRVYLISLTGGTAPKVTPTYLGVR